MNYSLQEGPPPVGRSGVLRIEHGFGMLPTWHTEEDPPSALLLYAHPDDEILFAAGLMLAHPEWRWHLVGATDCGPYREAERAKAHRMLKEFGVRIVLDTCLDLPDSFPHDPRAWYGHLEALELDCAITITHGYRGEYGHLHHIALNQIAHSLYPNVWDFFSPCKRVPQLLKSRVNVVQTTETKAQIMGKAYMHTAATLWAGDPLLMQSQLTCLPEYYTSDVRPVAGEWPDWKWA